MNLPIPSIRETPSPTAWQRIYDGWLSASTAMLGFFLLFSPAGTSIALLGLALACLFMLGQGWRLRIWAEPFVWVGLTLFVFIALHGLWMPRQAGGQWGILGSYGELWRAPILLIVFALGGKSEVFWRALLVGALFYAGLSWSHWLGMSLLADDFFSARRISAGLGLLAVAWLALERAEQSHKPWRMRCVAIALALTVLFAIDGRTGHLILVVLAVLAGWFYGPRPWRWLLALLLPLLVMAGAMTSKAVQSRVADTLSIMQSQVQTAEVGSSGLRKEFYSFGLEMGMLYPVSGIGYGNIASHYQAWITEKARLDPRKAPYVAPEFSRPTNLHSEFLMQWVGGGVLALSLLAAWLASPLLSRGHRQSTRRSAIGVVLAFAIGCLVNSWLLDFTEGHVYVALMSWLLSERYRVAQPVARA